MVGGVIAHDVEKRRGRAPRIVQVGEGVTETGAEMEEGDRRLLRHAAIAVRRRRGHALEQHQDRADAGHAVERGNEMHLRGAGVGEAGIHPRAYQRPHQTFGPVHGHSPE